MIAVGNMYETKFPSGYRVRHEVIELKEGKVRLQVWGSAGSRGPMQPAKSGYRFWLKRSTVEQFWVPNKVKPDADRPR